MGAGTQYGQTAEPRGVELAKRLLAESQDD